MESENKVVLIAQMALTAGMSLEQAQREFRWAMIESALALTKGNRGQAARVLGIHRNSLLRHIQQMAEKGRVIKKHRRYRVPEPSYYVRSA